MSDQGVKKARKPRVPSFRTPNTLREQGDQSRQTQLTPAPATVDKAASTTSTATNKKEIKDAKQIRVGTSSAASTNQPAEKNNKDAPPTTAQRQKGKEVDISKSTSALTVTTAPVAIQSTPMENKRGAPATQGTVDLAEDKEAPGISKSTGESTGSDDEEEVIAVEPVTMSTESVSDKSTDPAAMSKEVKDTTKASATAPSTSGSATYPVELKTDSLNQEINKLTNSSSQDEFKIALNKVLLRASIELGLYLSYIKDEKTDRQVTLSNLATQSVSRLKTLVSSEDVKISGFETSLTNVIKTSSVVKNFDELYGATLTLAGNGYTIPGLKETGELATILNNMSTKFTALSKADVSAADAILESVKPATTPSAATSPFDIGLFDETEQKVLLETIDKMGEDEKKRAYTFITLPKGTSKSPSHGGASRAIPDPPSSVVILDFTTQKKIDPPGKPPLMQKGQVITLPVNPLRPDLSKRMKYGSEDASELQLAKGLPEAHDINVGSMLFRHRNPEKYRGLFMAPNTAFATMNGVLDIRDAEFVAVADTNYKYPNSSTMLTSPTMSKIAARISGVTQLPVGPAFISTSDRCAWYKPYMIKSKDGSLLPAYYIHGQSKLAIKPLLVPLDFFKYGPYNYMSLMASGGSKAIDDAIAECNPDYEDIDGDKLEKEVFALDKLFQTAMERYVGMALSSGRECFIDVAIRH